MDAVLQALGDLYKEINRPSDPIEFIAHNLDHGKVSPGINPCPDKDEKIGQLKKTVEELNTNIKAAEVEKAEAEAAAAAPAEGGEPEAAPEPAAAAVVA
ncbi:hypothetical protein WDU94_010510 [Cyamophila willieti]